MVTPVSPSPTAVIAQRVEVARESAGISKLALADHTGIPRTTLNRKLKGHAEFTVSELMTISQALNVPFANWLADVA